MKKKFILPAAFALTLHAYLLFGLTAKTTPAALASNDPASKEKPDVLIVDPVESVRENSDDGGETPTNGPVDPLPRLADYALIPAPPNAPTLPPLPSVVSTNPGNVISPHWQEPAGIGGPRTEISDVSKLDRIPRARSQPPPAYPAALRHDGIEGTVVVEFKVDLDGNVYSATVLSATNPGFVDSALRAVERWKFEPGRKTGKKVRFRMSVPLVYSIDDK